MMPGMSGLGLAIARGAAELHGGPVIARNMPGGRLRVEIRLPSEDAVQELPVSHSRRIVRTPRMTSPARGDTSPCIVAAPALS